MSWVGCRPPLFYPGGPAFCREVAPFGLEMAENAQQNHAPSPFAACGKHLPRYLAFSNELF